MRCRVVRSRRPRGLRGNLQIFKLGASQRHQPDLLSLAPQCSRSPMLGQTQRRKSRFTARCIGGVWGRELPLRPIASAQPGPTPPKNLRRRTIPCVSSPPSPAASDAQSSGSDAEPPPENRQRRKRTAGLPLPSGVVGCLRPQLFVWGAGEQPRLRRTPLARYGAVAFLKHPACHFPPHLATPPPHGVVI